MGVINSGYVDLDYVVASVISERNEDDRWYEKYLQLAIRGYMDLQLGDSIKNIKSTELSVNSQNTVALPDDYIDYVSIALVFEGRLVPLTLNRNLAIPTSKICGVWDRTTITDTNGKFSDPYTYDSYLGSFLDDPDGTYNVAGGFNEAYYRIDEANHQIIFLQHKIVGLTIVLDYKATGLSKDVMIPRDAVPAIQAYIDWRLDKRSSNSSLSQIELSRAEWVRENSKLYAKRHALTIDEFLDIRYENTHRGLK